MLKGPMPRGFFVTGTDTEVGKTIVAGGIARMFSGRGISVGVMKPVASGAVRRGDALVARDAELLMAAAGCQSDADLVNPIRFEPPLAPTAAAELEGRILHASDLQPVWAAYAELRRRHEMMVVEGIGGLLVPLARGFSVADLAARLGLPLIIVGRSGLGTINHTALTVEAARTRGLEVAGVVLNGRRPDRVGDAERTNPGEIERCAQVSVLGTLPWMDGLDPEEPDWPEVARVCEEHLALWGKRFHDH